MPRWEARKGDLVEFDCRIRGKKTIVRGRVARRVFLAGDSYAIVADRDGRLYQPFVDNCRPVDPVDEPELARETKALFESPAFVDAMGSFSSRDSYGIPNGPDPSTGSPDVWDIPLRLCVKGRGSLPSAQLLEYLHWSVTTRKRFERAIRGLRAHAPRAAEVYLLMTFGGLSNAEIARELGIGKPRVTGAYARAAQYINPRMGWITGDVTGRTRAEGRMIGDDLRRERHRDVIESVIASEEARVCREEGPRPGLLPVRS